MHKTDFIQKLREVRGCLDAQTGLLKTKESQLQQCQSTELLELRQKVRIEQAVILHSIVINSVKMCEIINRFFITFQLNTNVQVTNII